LGEKPLYYGWAGGAFVFGSELKALRAFPGFANPVCRGALAQYLRFLYVPAPRSIYAGLYKLEPGCLLTLRCGSGDAPVLGAAPEQPLRPPADHGPVRLRRWWSLAEAVETGARAPFCDETEALAALDAQLALTVRQQSLADVPLGAFLSGGVDSSLIVALMQRQATRPVLTFTVGFEEGAFDESPHARAVAHHLGTEHTELLVTAAETRAVIPHLPTLYDEPFADSSQIPTHLVCAAARRRVTVALSGDGGDELFGGYNRYFWAPRIWDRVGWLPFPLRRALGAGIRRLSPAAWDALGRVFNRRRSGAGGIAQLGDKAHKLAARLERVRGDEDLYQSLVSEWPDPATLVRPAGAPVREPPSLLADPLPLVGVEEGALRMMYRDSLTYLPDDILCKVDRAAMGVSLETRVPYLDHRVVELAWRLPLSMKIRENQGKWALRQLLYREVPRALIERPKAGFGVPVGEWLRGPLRDWAEDLLAAERIKREGYLHPAPIRAAWQEHLSGQRDWTMRLWSVLMFEAWLASRG
jgi:asparagine synthase (glutamine-hydrolysing)